MVDISFRNQRWRLEMYMSSSVWFGFDLPKTKNRTEKNIFCKAKPNRSYPPNRTEPTILVWFFG